MRIEYLYRFPVKGLTAEALEETIVEPGGTIPWDRVFALAQGDSGFDAAKPIWLPKTNFMCLARNAKAAKLAAFFEPRTGALTLRAPDGSEVSANALRAEGRETLGDFLTRYLGDEARGTPHFEYAAGHTFADGRAKTVSLINMASLHDLEAKVGARRHRRRFRANVWFSGVPAWGERDWVGQEIQMGGAVLKVIKNIPRCPATEVNPETAERDANPVAELQRLYGHKDLGVYAEVVEGGRFAVGDAIEILGGA
jgi:uncharacterized protein YcbX